MDAMDLLHSDDGLMTDSVKMSGVDIRGRDPMIKQEARRNGVIGMGFFFIYCNPLFWELALVPGELHLSHPDSSTLMP